MAIKIIIIGQDLGAWDTVSGKVWRFADNPGLQVINYYSVNSGLDTLTGHGYYDTLTRTAGTYSDIYGAWSSSVGGGSNIVYVRDGGQLIQTTDQAVTANFSALAPWLYDPANTASFVVDSMALPGNYIAASVEATYGYTDEALFRYLFSNFTDEQCPLLNSSYESVLRSAFADVDAAVAAYALAALPAWELVGPASSTDGFVIRASGGLVTLNVPFTTAAGLTSRRTGGATFYLAGDGSGNPSNALQGDFINDDQDGSNCFIGSSFIYNSFDWAGFSSGLWSGKLPSFDLRVFSNSPVYRFDTPDSVVIMDASADRSPNTQDAGTFSTNKAVFLSSTALSVWGYEGVAHLWSGHITTSAPVTSDSGFSGMTLQSQWMDAQAVQHYQAADIQWNWGATPKQSEKPVVCDGNIAGRMQMTNLLNTFQHTNSGSGGVVADYSRAYRSTLPVGGN